MQTYNYNLQPKYIICIKKLLHSLFSPVDTVNSDRQTFVQFSLKWFNCLLIMKKTV